MPLFNASVLASLLFICVGLLHQPTVDALRQQVETNVKDLSFGSSYPMAKRPYFREPLRFGKRFGEGSAGGGGLLINPFLYEAYRNGADPFQK
uniref:Uncharacterized protein n=1 Tax=Globodera pallida TaxID=36090 RepID=A0A183BM85_GLOPA